MPVFPFPTFNSADKKQSLRSPDVWEEMSSMRVSAMPIPFSDDFASRQHVQSHLMKSGLLGTTSKVVHNIQVWDLVSRASGLGLGV